MQGKYADECAESYRDVPLGRPAFNKRNMRNDKLTSQINEIQSDENNYYHSQRLSNTTIESCEMTLHTYFERHGRNEYTGLAKKNSTLRQSAITFFGMRQHFKIFIISLRQYIA